MLNEFTQKIESGHNLSIAEATSSMDIIMDGKAENSQMAEFLLALKHKGETSDEVAGCVNSMRNHSLKINLDDSNAVDGCGTGGDGSDSFNVSTGVTVIKCRGQESEL